MSKDEELRKLGEELLEAEKKEAVRRYNARQHYRNDPYSDLAHLCDLPEPQFDLQSLLETRPAAPPTQLLPRRSLLTGQVEDYEELAIPSPTNALSMQRRPKPQQGLMGSSSNAPFLPGGMELDKMLQESAVDDPEDLFRGQFHTFQTLKMRLTLLNLVSELCTVIPGVGEGVEFEEERCKEAEIPVAAESADIFSLLDLISADPLLDAVPPPPASTSTHEAASTRTEEEELVAAVLPPSSESQKPRRVAERPVTRKFAIQLDTSRRDPDFAKKVPRMARIWPFQLDPWQEAGVACLERGESIFVSAHTSAGKTVPVFVHSTLLW